MIAGFYSPLPPARTGVADYSAALLAQLRTHGRVEVAPERCDIALYHLGNNRLHAKIYRRALRHPGVIVLHDAVLHHFLLGLLDERGYIEEFVYNYGEWNRGLARDLWRGRAAITADSRYFEYPLLRRAVEGARAVVVHNPAAARAVLRHAPDARVIEFPHLFAPPPLPSAAEAMRFRARLGIGPGVFLFGVFGFLRESKRITCVLDAFLELRRENRRAMLLLAGDFVSPELARAIEPYLSQAGIVRLPYLKERDFWVAASAIDVCINLRFPAAGETSGIAIRLMGLGKPVMVTDSEEYSAFPEDACIRVAPGAAERASLLAHMSLLTSMSEVAHAVGMRSAAHIQGRHGVSEIGKRYWDLLCEYCM